MRLSKLGYAAIAAIGLTLGATHSARALDEATPIKDQCYRLQSEASGSCSTCKEELCQSGTYCCAILRLGPSIAREE